MQVGLWVMGKLRVSLFEVDRKTDFGLLQLLRAEVPFWLLATAHDEQREAVGPEPEGFIGFMLRCRLRRRDGV